MKHCLHDQRIILCHPAVWHSRAELLDDIAADSLDQLRARDDGENEYDYWGDKLPKMRVENGIAIIPFCGVVTQGLPRIYRKFGYLDLGDVRRDLQAALADDAVKRVVLDMDSPGGMVSGTPETAELVARADAEKGVTTFVRGMACSAAYWVAAAGRITAPPSADVGSIGVYTYLLEDREHWEKEGVKIRLFKSGTHKAAGFPGNDVTQEQAEFIQADIDTIGARFRGHVNAHRPGVATDTMQGQSFQAIDAKPLGLVDELSCDLAAILTEHIGSKASTAAKPPTVAAKPKPAPAFNARAEYGKLVASAPQAGALYYRQHQPAIDTGETSPSVPSAAAFLKALHDLKERYNGITDSVDKTLCYRLNRAALDVAHAL
jgi:signal peptide peptidase SppA